ncbi:MAG: CBS domain-containing protein [Acidimicrobiales bacterium]
MNAANPRDPISRLSHAKPFEVRATDSLREAATVLTENRVGLLVVRGSEGIVGVVSERDIVAFIADEGDCDEGRVGDIMTTELVIVEPHATISAVASTMLDSDVRHLLVGLGHDVDGIVSVRDLLKVFFDA